MRLHMAALLAATLFAGAGCADAGDPLAVATAESASVVGGWVVVHPANDGARTEQRLHFAADGSFRSELLWIGFYGLPANEVTGYLRSRGRYRVEGDRLMLRLERQEEWQKYAVGPNPSVYTPPRAWSDRGSVRVENERLIHTFVSAPADAPETFTEVYDRDPAGN